jgi:hypothetical protein
MSRGNKQLIDAKPWKHSETERCLTKTWKVPEMEHRHTTLRQVAHAMCRDLDFHLLGSMALYPLQLASIRRTLL